MRPLFLCLASLLAPAWLSAENRNDWQQPDRVMADLNLRPGTRIADVGCGSGYFSLRMAGAVGESGKVFAVDISANSLQDLQKVAERQGFSNLAPILSQGSNTRLEPECADAVFFCDVLHEVPPAQRQALVASAARAVKPGGFLYLMDYRKSRDIKFDPYEKLIPRDDLVGMASAAGLRLDAEFHYLKYQVFLRFRK